MHLGILALGLGSGLLIALLLRAAERRTAARHATIDARGTDGPGAVVGMRSTGRYAESRAVEVRAWDGSTFRETLPAMRARELGLAEGVAVTVRVVPGEAGMGRMVLPPEAPSRFNTPIFAGAFIAVLGVLAALVV